MIFIEQQAEPDYFDRRVRQKGLRALEKCDFEPPQGFWATHRYWRLAHYDLVGAYNHTCAYLGIRIFRKHARNETRQSSVEHFIPKSDNPRKAYDWDNYLLASATANKRRDRKPILDPRTIPDDLFRLRLNSGLILVNRDHPRELVDQAKKTIENIDLNCEEFRFLRALMFKNYQNNPAKLENLAPFVYREAVRQKKI